MPKMKHPFNGKEQYYVDEFIINTKPVSITVECPKCGEKFTEDIGMFIWEDLWYNGEYTECPECGCEFKLEGACYDINA